ncbi:uridine kinase [Streptoalloteichus tenebrarius]|uniref:Uridine kinase n=1 Tax=Streptoalloteichus tenebrarius (strain ATCC 17920 / DSM 40477 / JCM 4838 / CBS 697.72 / NBRC 16177 / NCIMB 11028 / NRRL B-12390 / A12253. 1 / ISP 5477) TaxID=1933 RepID=A0ABT1HSB6_STRSD|nr:uridine kinase [Streptoalloteichus tenebrarius]MCP2258409.1 uridine kinase [Streptoalloteichus tenebrarius]
MPSPAVEARPAQVVLLAGPSGSGKSTLAARLNWPVLRLDDFYRDGDDPLLPRDAEGRVDWDDPDAWAVDEAFEAIAELCAHGSVAAPVYEIGADRRVDTRELRLDGAPVFFAEGLFADRLVGRCREAGLLADALVLAPRASVTFVRRFVRDVSEARKPVPVLVRRGMRLWREHRHVVDRCLRAGMRACLAHEAAREMAALRAELAAPPLVEPVAGAGVAAPNATGPIGDRLVNT